MNEELIGGARERTRVSAHTFPLAIARAHLRPRLHFAQPSAQAHQLVAARARLRLDDAAHKVDIVFRLVLGLDIIDARRRLAAAPAARQDTARAGPCDGEAS